jgi:hypothetical protein
VLAVRGHGVGGVRVDGVVSVGALDRAGRLVACLDGVVAGAAGDLVVSVPGDELVVATATVDDVVAVKTVEFVGAVVADQVVVSG